MTFVEFRAATLAVAALCLFSLGGGPSAATAASTDLTAYMQAVAAAASQDAAIADFYRDRDYAPFWTAADGAERRAALLTALSEAPAHGLPAGRYDPDALVETFRTASSLRDVGRAEVGAMQAFLRYATDVNSGVLKPSAVVPDIKREVHRPDPAALMAGIETAPSPAAFLRDLAPTSPEYARLMREKLRLERAIREGGWGPEIAVRAVKPGETGPAVVALRNRLIEMGYLGRTASPAYDSALQQAVQAFQSDHGLDTDGVAGTATVEEINVSPEDRLKSVLVAMERERWLGNARGDRHVLVNITDFHASIVENGEIVFRTRSVVGKNRNDTRTPEFSDVMEHMIVNPTWNVPRSIVVKEYLPKMQANPNAAGHLVLVDRRGRAISRGAIDFTQFNARNFPFEMKQPPSRRNALGLVKFMFPNPYNIYLHDTPSKSLFDREVRAYSHGCIRLSDPFDFAYALLADQTDDPVAFFKSKLATGREIQVNLEHPLPVHIIYRTAMSDPKGRMQYRRDVYGRDAAIFDALAAAGVALVPLRG